MGLLFWFVFFAIMGTIFKKIKSSWHEKNFSRVTMWVVTAILVFMIMAFFRQYIIQQKREQWRNEYHGSAVQYELPCKNFDLKEVHLQ